MSVAENYQHRQLSACHLPSQYAGTWFCLDNGRQAAASELSLQKHSVPFILSSRFGGPKLIDGCGWLINQAAEAGNRWALANIWHICRIEAGWIRRRRLPERLAARWPRSPPTPPRHLQPDNQQVAFLKPLLFFVLVCICRSSFPSLTTAWHFPRSSFSLPFLFLKLSLHISIPADHSAATPVPGHQTWQTHNGGERNNN